MKFSDLLAGAAAVGLALLAFWFMGNEWSSLPEKWVVHKPMGNGDCVGVIRYDLQEPIAQSCDEFDGDKFSIKYVSQGTYLEDMQIWLSARTAFN